MNISAWIAQNEKTLAIAGAVGVGGLALVMRKKKGTSSTSASSPTTTTTAGAPGATLAGTVPVSGYAGAYDSQASDVYNALQSQSEAQYTSLAQILKDQKTGLDAANQSLANLGSLDTGIANGIINANQSLANLGQVVSPPIPVTR